MMSNMPKPYEVQAVPRASGTLGGAIGAILATGCGGYLAGIFGAVAVGTVLAKLRITQQQGSGPAWFVGVVCALAAGWFIFRAVRAASYRNMIQRARTMALAAINNAREHAVALPRYLDGARHHLDEAESRFHGRLYGPFWDSVVAAAGQLESFSNSIMAIQQDEIAYETALRSAQHTFPGFYSVMTLPDPSHMIRRYAEVVRGGEADFNFASIWEQRKTAEVIDKRLAAVIGAVHSATARLSTLVGEIRASGVQLEGIHADTTKIREVAERDEQR